MMTYRDERKAIFERVASGELSAEAAAEALAQLDAAEEKGLISAATEIPAWEKGAEAEVLSPVHAEPAPEPISADDKHKLAGWRSLWILFFIIGLILTTISASWMIEGYHTAGLSWGFWLSFIPLLIGLTIAVIAWESKKALWLHVRIQQKPGEKPERLAFSFPLPLSMIGWGVARFSDKMPAAQAEQVSEFIRSLKQDIKPDEPFSVVADDKDGEKVEIWIDAGK